MPLAQRPLKAVLNEVICPYGIPQYGPRVALQCRDRRFNLGQEPHCALPCQVPNAFHPVTGGLASSAIIDPRIKRPALIGPLARSIGPNDNAKITRGTGAARGL